MPKTAVNKDCAPSIRYADIRSTGQRFAMEFVRNSQFAKHFPYRQFRRGVPLSNTRHKRATRRIDSAIFLRPAVQNRR